MRSASRVPPVAAAAALAAAVAAQPTFTSIEVRDSVALDLEPLPEHIGASQSVFVARAWLAKDARERLRRALGMRYVFAPDARTAGPALLTLSPCVRIPGDRRLRVELEAGAALEVLGLGASVAETEAAARGEPWPRAILIGVNPAAEPRVGFERLGAADARPVVWVRGVSVHGDFAVPHGRRFAIMDGGGGSAEPVGCEGSYPEPLRGVCAGADGGLFWSFTDRLVRTDARGARLAEVTAPERWRLGDLTWHAGEVFVAADAPGAGASVRVHDATSLAVVREHRLAELQHPAGGICRVEGRFVVAEAAADRPPVVHVYDGAFRHLRAVELRGDRLEVRTAEYALGRLWLGCAGAAPCLVVAAPDLSATRRWNAVDCRSGITRGPDGSLWIGRSARHDEGHAGRLLGAWPTPRLGLMIFGR